MRATAFTLSCMLEAMNSSLLAMDMLNYKSLHALLCLSCFSTFRFFTSLSTTDSKPPSPRDNELTSASKKRVSSLPLVYTGQPAFEIDKHSSCV